MKRICLIAVLVTLPFGTQAQPVAEAILKSHIFPRFEALATASSDLANKAQESCAPASKELRGAYHAAFDAWVSASHLRFGPTERQDRAFALAFWPDSRGATPRTLAALIADKDPVATSADAYGDVSIAARGFYALEFLLFDDTLKAAGDPAYHCALVQTVSSDISNNASAILVDWTSRYAGIFLAPGPEGRYRSEEEVLQELLKALSTGLQFTSEARLGRPLGTFDRPRPNRAEARRSERSARHVALSLSSLQDLAIRLAGLDTALAADFSAKFAIAQNGLTALNDPVFKTGASLQTRIKVEVVQQNVDSIRSVVTQELGPTLGVAAGFNSLDGD